VSRSAQEQADQTPREPDEFIAVIELSDPRWLVFYAIALQPLSRGGVA
jgi:hypothetical protein